MRAPLLLLISAVTALASPPGQAGGLLQRLFAQEDPPQQVEIADPYIELHTGPGRGYPVFHVEERGRWIEIQKRKTDWFKVRTDKGKEGWVSLKQLEQTLSPSGQPTEVREATFEEFRFHRLEIGALGGSFERADTMTAYGAFWFTPNISAELSVAKIFSANADSEMANAGLLIHPFPEWRISPFFTVGTGILRTNPKTTLVQESDRIDQLAHVGAGIRVYIARQFVFRAQYKNYLIFQSTNDNQEIDEWLAGLSVFF